MVPRTRRPSFPKVLIEKDSDSEESSSEEEDDADEVDGEESPVEEEDEPSNSTSSKIGRKPITISLKKVCKVCKKPGHEAGFRDNTYVDCPMKPCFLCKMPGHTTMTCPDRVATEHGVAPAPFKIAYSPLD